MNSILRFLIFLSNPIIAHQLRGGAPNDDGPPIILVFPILLFPILLAL